MATTHQNLDRNRRALVEADLFTAIAAVAATEDDLQRILQAALEYLRDVIPFTGGSIALVEGDQLIIHAADGPFAASALGYRMTRNTGACWRVIETGQTFISNNVQEHHRRTSGGFKSYLAVPLTWRGQTMGLLEIDSTEANAFTEADVELLHKVAILLGGPMVLARQLQELRVEIGERKRTEQRLAVQYAITTLLAEAQSFPQVAPEILHTIATALGWDLGCVWCIDRQVQALRCSHTWHAESIVAHTFLGQSREISAAGNVGLPGRVWASGQPLWSADLPSDLGFLRRDAAAQTGLRSGFSFPICGNEEVFGTFEFFSRQPRQPDQDLLTMAAALGRQIGQFIDRRRAETARQRAEEARRFLVDSTRVLGSSLDYEPTLQSVAHMTIPFLADWCVIDLLQDDGAIHMIAVAHIDPANEWLAARVRECAPLSENDRHTIWQVLRSGKSILSSVITDDFLAARAKNAEHLGLLRAMNIRSQIVVPLVARERTLGTISLVSAQPGRYSADDRVMVEDLAQRAALAIDNARLYREAQAAIEMRDEFLSIASHELKTPLTTLLGYTQALQRRLARDNLLNERDQRAMGVIEQQALRLTKQIDTLLDLSRIELGQFNLEYGAIDLPRMLRRIVMEREPTLDRHRLEATIPEEALTILGDPGRLEQVIQNLLQNAIKYSPNGGTIALGIERQQQLAVISVSDQGVGIPETARPHLFQRFYRASNVTGRNMSGMGIGLYLVDLIVKLHHGTVEYISAEEQGSTFIVRLPLHDQ